MIPSAIDDDVDVERGAISKDDASWSIAGYLYALLESDSAIGKEVAYADIKNYVL